MKAGNTSTRTNLPHPASRPIPWRAFALAALASSTLCAQSAIWLPANASSGNIHYSGGNVGIGAPSSNALLGLYENRYDLGLLDLMNPRADANAGVAVRFITPDTATTGWTSADLVRYQDGRLEIKNWGNNASIAMMTAGVLHFKITPNGNVGIGTANPQHKLAVNGAIKAKDIIVTSADWSDYVFTPGYPLPPLSAVEAHIQARGHLPGIPSAREVEANGVSVGRMQAKLLEKVEELTLHLIRQEKQNQELRARLARLESGLAAQTPSQAGR